MHDELQQEILKQMTRRTFFKQVGYGMGGLALSSLLLESGFGSTASAGTGAHGSHWHRRSRSFRPKPRM